MLLCECGRLCPTILSCSPGKHEQLKTEHHSISDFSEIFIWILDFEVSLGLRLEGEELGCRLQSVALESVCKCHDIIKDVLQCCEANLSVNN